MTFPVVIEKLHKKDFNMNYAVKIILCILAFSSAAYADNSGFTPGEVKLNNQIQAQIKNLQAQQQQQLTALNTKLQAQIQKVQSDLEKEMQIANTQTQNQLKQLQSQIK
jgi:Skp family chaperone for outer membrane proteins